MLTKVFGSALVGIKATTITVEVNTSIGVGYHLVGLPDNAIKESNYRIAAALQNNGYRIPGKKITLNMAPADLRKEGAAYDLTLAMGILIASGQIEAKEALSDYLIMGELSLDGGLLPIKGALSIALNARDAGFAAIVLPSQNAQEASIVEDIIVYGAENLGQVIDHFTASTQLEPVSMDLAAQFYQATANPELDFADVKGQETVKRCMEIAAAGGHNILLIGPPGSGKSMLAKRMPGILPPLSLSEALETTQIHSVTGGTMGGLGVLTQRPFRSPHHTISDVALVGGGQYPQPGEISLAHNGVLFLDELPEFKRSVLEVMRQPLEDREVTISRARFTVTYPASFMLVASMNPSPGGYFNDPDAPRQHSPQEMQRYLGKLSGPLLDRIDLHIEVSKVPFEDLSDDRRGEPSSEIRKRVAQARAAQSIRFKDAKTHYNAQMQVSQLRAFCQLSKNSMDLLGAAMDKLNLSARAYDRILKVARTIADLERKENIETAHIAEAIQYRSLDRPEWSALV